MHHPLQRYLPMSFAVLVSCFKSRQQGVDGWFNAFVLVKIFNSNLICQLIAKKNDKAGGGETTGRILKQYSRFAVNFDEVLC